MLPIEFDRLCRDGLSLLLLLLSPIKSQRLGRSFDPVAESKLLLRSLLSMTTGWSNIDEADDAEVDKSTELRRECVHAREGRAGLSSDAPSHLTPLAQSAEVESMLFLPWEDDFVGEPRELVEVDVEVCAAGRREDLPGGGEDFGDEPENPETDVGAVDNDGAYDDDERQLEKESSDELPSSEGEADRIGVVPSFAIGGRRRSALGVFVGEE